MYKRVGSSRQSRVCKGDFLVPFVNYGCMIGGSCPTLKSSHRAANKSEFLRTGDCETHKQRVLTNPESAAETKLLNTSVILGGEGDEKKDIYVAKVLLLCLYFVKGDTKGVELALVQCVECVSP